MIEIIVVLLVAVMGVIAYKVYHRQRAQASSPVALEDADQLPLLLLQPKISWCKYLENVDDLGTRLAAQYQMCRQLGKLSFDVLRQKFAVGELTFERYEKTLFETNSVLADNLSKIVPLLEALDSVASQNTPKKQDYIQRTEGLLTLNQTLLDKLNELVTNLSDIKNLTGPDQKTIDFLLDNIKSMTERAKLY
ncbi:hypothetical protein [Candidatus Berkiella aquae]|uniref:Uncharacterized protein n=1 Tax=Candidatus Berkiella aquae TaxID=295108 RepID=A0A0Q9YQG5_9GAMM|nr:hypothetical protein [Candidatus Berkiella aquae]MCS5709955.1 hypothetical protein [Candidatus Berkiella aquae]